LNGTTAVEPLQAPPIFDIPNGGNIDAGAVRASGTSGTDGDAKSQNFFKRCGVGGIASGACGRSNSGIQIEPGGTIGA